MLVDSSNNDYNVFKCNFVLPPTRAVSSPPSLKYKISILVVMKSSRTVQCMLLARPRDGCGARGDHWQCSGDNWPRGRCGGAEVETADTGHQWPVVSALSVLTTPDLFTQPRWQSEDWSVNFPLYLYQWNEKLLPLKNMFTTKLWPHSDINIVLHNKSVKPKHTYTNASFYCKHCLVNSRIGHSRMETFHQN